MTQGGLPAARSDCAPTPRRRRLLLCLLPVAVAVFGARELPASLSTGCLLCLLLLATAVLPLGLFVARYPWHPAPVGEVAAQLGCLRVRLPPAPGASRPGPMVQVIYPAQPGGAAGDVGCGCAAALGSGGYFRHAAIEGISASTGFPRWLGYLTLWRPAVEPPRRPAVPSLSEGNGWPFVVFSSGLHGCLEVYTQLGREVAASGAIYVAVEHEDGSGAYAEDAVTGEAIPFRKPPPGVVGVRDKIVEFRRPFLETRVAELKATIAHVKSASRGQGPEPAASDPRATLLQEILSGGDADSVVLAGHSFGAASVVMALQQGLGKQVKGALLFDPWLEALPDSAIRAGLPVPNAIFLSEQWAVWEAELSRVHELRAASRGRTAGCARFDGTRHQWISDAPLWMPSAVLRKVRVTGETRHELAHDATARAATLALGHILERSTGQHSDSLESRLSAINPGLVRST